MEETIRILVVDDEPDIRRICRILLENSGYTVLEAATGLEAVETIRRCPEIDLILMDIMMPDLDGYDACSRLRACSTAPVLFLTAKTQENDKRRAYDAGGDDYLAKPFGMMEMVSRIRAVLRRTAPAAAPGLLQMGNLRMDSASHTVYAGDTRVELTLKEFDLLKLFLEHPGRVFTRDQLLERIWSTDYVGETRTVDVHIGTLRTKLGQCGEYIRTVRGVGYRMEA